MLKVEKESLVKDISIIIQRRQCHETSIDIAMRILSKVLSHSMKIRLPEIESEVCCSDCSKFCCQQRVNHFKLDTKKVLTEAGILVTQDKEKPLNRGVTLSRGGR